MPCGAAVCSGPWQGNSTCYCPKRLAMKCGWCWWLMRLCQSTARACPPLRGPDLPHRQLVDSAVTELEQIADAQMSTAGLAARHAGLLWWLSRPWALWHAVPDGRGRVVHPAVDRAARLWRDDPTRGVPKIVQEVGLSPGRQGRTFRTDLGHSVADYRIDQKLARAADLRAEAAHQNWTMIALYAGFGGYSQFYRAWVARHGICPTGKAPRSAESV